MFDEITEQQAEEQLTELRKELEQVNIAKSANDMRKLYELGYANKVPHPTDDRLFKYEFRQGRYDDLVADCKKSAHEYMVWYNEALNK